MPRLVETSILIPFLPLLSALLIGTLLVCFSRTMNRLTKPVSFLIINSVAFSTLFSLFLLYKHVTGQVGLAPLGSFQLSYQINLVLNNYSEISIALVGFIAVLIMLVNYIKSPRNNGYVRNLVTFSSFLGILFLFLLSDTFINIIPS